MALGFCAGVVLCLKGVGLAELFGVGCVKLRCTSEFKTSERLEPSAVFYYICGGRCVWRPSAHVSQESRLEGTCAKVCECMLRSRAPRGIASPRRSTCPCVSCMNDRPPLHACRQASLAGIIDNAQCGHSQPHIPAIATSSSLCLQPPA
jgi:hypothetical protein